MQDTRTGTGQGLNETEVERLSALFVPNPRQFSGDRNRRRQRPNLYVEIVAFDEHGEEQIGWMAPRKVDGATALPAHFQAGQTHLPALIPSSDCPPIRAISLGYEETDELGWFSLDLDGGYPIDRIGPALAQVLGKKRLVCHSGSGKPNRFRVFGRLDKPLTVRRLNELLTALCAHLGFPVKDKHVEIFPAYRHSRIPLGLGGCQRFELTTGNPIGKPDQAKLGRAILVLEPIDLEVEIAKLGVVPSGIDTGIRRSRGRFDPHTRRERQRSTPRHIRKLLHRGVTRPGERQKLQHTFFVDCLLSGYPLHDAIPRFHAYVDSGKFDASSDVTRYGREWLKRQAPRIAKGIYASTRPVGMPDPIACDGAEIHRIRKIAKRVAAEQPEFSERKAEDFLKKILAIFKGCIAACLPLARIHSKTWQAAGGTHYARLRAACGIFDARSGYKSLKLVMSRAHLGARPCEAKAIDWSTSFVFDQDLPAPSYEISKSIFAGNNTPHDPIVVVPIPSVSFTLPGVLLSSTTAREQSSRLYVHHHEIKPKFEGSDLPTSSSNSFDSTPQTTSIQPDPVQSSDARLRRPGRPVNASKVPRTTRSPSERSKVPEWRRLRNWAPPATADQSLDEFLEACIAAKKLVKEYNRERARAKRRQTIFNREARRSRDFIPFASLGECASDRFHELRAMFGLELWACSGNAFLMQHAE